MGLSAAEFRANGLYAIAGRCGTEMRAAHNALTADSSRSKGLTLCLVTAMKSFCEIARVIAERGYKHREEETLRGAYGVYMHANTLSNNSAGLQVDPAYFLTDDKLENWGSDIGLATTINQGVELGWNMRVDVLEKDLGKLRSINDQAAQLRQRWYPMSIEALEKAIDARRACLLFAGRT
ncbi:hypothetical protein P171DRAFT_186032 [Karstenula rhodostoma CBS 690.94]|uniref:Uncharacterized protein n=1 Tax=Karstenula rhodostoma CBS 690.94 TaxID=1392251 RepID=A0A9P4UHB2_9PLEO|nr:hypothetical protein P171DRAFT_186032 [Karstenula rhodostoma CBS 690.94]